MHETIQVIVEEDVFFERTKHLLLNLGAAAASLPEHEQADYRASLESIVQARSPIIPSQHQ